VQLRVLDSDHAGRKTVTVTASAVTSSSIVLATLQISKSGLYVQGAVPGAGSFTINLNKTASADLPVGWFVISEFTSIFRPGRPPR
jgi:hypothetical protein